MTQSKMARRLRDVGEMKTGLITLVVGLSLALPAWFGIPDGPLTALHPFPFLSMMVGFLSVARGWGLVSVLVLWPALFFLWNPALFRGSRAVPRRTYALWLFTTVLSMGWFASYLINWHDFSRRWHDVEDIQKWRSINALSAAFAILLGLLLSRAWVRREVSFASNTMFAWLAWSAFPAPPTI